MLDCTMESITLSDGYRAHARWWCPPNPRGAVLYFHGIQSHGGWYERSGARLADRQLAVLMPDRRGSGRNRQQRGHVDSVERCIQDGKDALELIQQRTGFPTVHLVGVSWGGRLAVALVDAEPQCIRTISLVAPGLFPKVDISTGEKLRVAMSMLNERSRLFDIPLNDPGLFTTNPERIAFFRADDLKLTQVSASFLLASRRLDRRIRRLDRSDWKGAIHLLLAGRDKIIDNEPTRRWFHNLALPDGKISEYADAEHTLEFEPDPDAFFSALTDWIADRCDSRPG